MSVDWLKIYSQLDHGQRVVYRLDDLKSNFEVRKLCRDDGWLVLSRNDEDEYGCWLKFAVLGFAESEGNGKNTKVSCVFYGEGPTGSLRECRHTYWGKDGYIFYPNGPIICAAFTALAEFFDGMQADSL